MYINTKVRIGVWSLLILSLGIFSLLYADVRVNQDPPGILQNEPSITLNPATHGNIVTAYNEGPGTIGISYSMDYGVTWADTHITPVWGYEFDPSIDADLNGNIFVGFCSARGQFFSGTTGVYVAVSSDNGQTWTNTQVEVFYNSPSNPGPFLDKDYIAVDNYPSSPFRDNVYIVWERDTWDYIHAAVYAAVSTDGGQTFTHIQKVSDSAWSVSQCLGQVPKVAPNGYVYVAWVDYPLQGHTTAYLYIDKSTDGGLTWGNDVLVDSFLAVPSYPDPGVTSFYVRSYPTLGIDPSNSNNIYIAFAADPDGLGGPDDGDIFLVASHDGGNTWSSPVRVNDDLTLNDQFQPWMDVKPNGVIDIVWIDRRNDPLNWLFDVYFAYSTDNGQTFSSNIRVSDVPIGPLNEPNSWMGEYIGIDVDSSRAYIAWTDTRTGDRDIFFDTMANPPTKLNEGSGTLPFGADILAITPNPARKKAEFQFMLEKETAVSLKIYDASGRLVRELSPSYTKPGVNRALWDGRDQNGLSVNSGIYFINLSIGEYSLVKKLVWLK